MSNVAPDVSVSVNVDRVASDVWRVVADPRRLADLSPEASGVSTAGDGSGPMGLGVVFSGANRNGIFRWSTRCVVVESTPDIAFAFDVSYFGLAVARWRYAITATAAGTRVDEQWWDHRGALMTALGLLGTGVSDRRAHNEKTMRATLDALRDHLEKG